MGFKLKKRTRGCLFFLGGLLLVTLLVAVIAFVCLDRKLSLRSNLVYVEFGNSHATLEIKDQSGDWVKPADLTQQSFELALDKRVKREGKGFSWRTLKLKRTAHNWREHMINSSVSCEVHVIKFDPEHFDLSPWYQMDDSSGKFIPQTIQSALATETVGPYFAINASYYGPDGQPLGWIVKDGKTVRKRWKGWSGFFFVKDGEPRFGPRSSLDARTGELTHALQGYPSVMKDGKVWKYVENDDDQFFNGSELNFRSLAGVDKNGHCIFITSGRGGLLTMANVSEIALLAGVQDATLLDGGKALQYGMKTRHGNKTFQSYNNDLPKKWSKGYLKPQKPPVFIVARRKQEAAE